MGRAALRNSCDRLLKGTQMLKVRAPVAQHLQEPLLLTFGSPAAVAEHLPLSITGCCGFLEALPQVKFSLTSTLT